MSNATSNRLLAVLAAGFAFLVALGAVTAVTNEPEPLDVTSPDGVTQQFVEAILADDIEAARSFFTHGLRRDCASDRLRPRRHPGRITVAETIVRDDAATVRLRFSSTSTDDPFNLSSWSYERDVDLRRAGDLWLINATEWPWYSCREERPSP